MVLTLKNETTSESAIESFCDKDAPYFNVAAASRFLTTLTDDLMRDYGVHCTQSEFIADDGAHISREDFENLAAGNWSAIDESVSLETLFNILVMYFDTESPRYLPKFFED